jgi:hypothetical protein
MLFKGYLTILTIIFFYNDADRKNWRRYKRHIKVHVVKISASGSLQFWRYTPWKIGFFTIHETSIKHVFQVKQS